MQILKDQVVVITGATRGIGRATCLTLAKVGAKVVFNYNSSSSAADKMVEEISKNGGSAIAVQGNISDFATSDKLIKTAIDNYGRIDILVNNAGITNDGLFMRMKEKDWDSVLDVNLKGVFHSIKAAIKPMMKQKYGRIINISSVVGITGNIGQANYAAAKAGIVGLTKSVAKELGSRNILVNSIAPGYIETDMTSKLSDDIKENVLKNIPLGRLGKPKDIAQVVLFLSSPAANYITGQTIIVDGGMVMQ